MTQPPEHPTLAPILCEFIPVGRGPTDVALYKFLRWWARKNRRQNYDVAVKAFHEMSLYGTSTVRIGKVQP